jgi:hypothetical protein
MSHDPTITPAAPSWYVARRIPMSPTDATRALGETLRAGAVAPGRAADIAVDGVHHTRPGEARGFTGRLRLGRALTPTIRVEIEVEPWSWSESVLGVRPMRRPPRFRADRYFRRVLSLLDGLEADMVERVGAPAARAEIRRAS